MPTGFFKFKGRYSIVISKKANKTHLPNQFVIKLIYLCVVCGVCVCVVCVCVCVWVTNVAIVWIVKWVE